MQQDATQTERRVVQILRPYENQRFAQFLALTIAGLAQLFEHAVAVWGFRLRAGQGVSSLTVHRFQPNRVVASHTADRAFQQRLAVAAQAHFPGKLFRERLARLAIHQLQGRVRAGIGKDVQKR